MFVGGMIRYAVDKLRGEREAQAEFSPGVLLSSGYIAGAAITGVLLAIIAIPGEGAYLRAIDLPFQIDQHFPGAIANWLATVRGDQPTSNLWSNLWGLAFFAGLAAYLLRTGIRGRSAAQPTRSPNTD